MSLIFPKKFFEIRDIQWHPYQPYGLLILFSDKILFYRFDKSIHEANYELLFKELKNEKGN